MPDPTPSSAAAWSAADVASILRDSGWLPASTSAHSEWLAAAAALLSPHAPSKDALRDLLAPIFEYDAHLIASQAHTHAIFMRPDAREVLRTLAPLIFAASVVDSDRLKEIFTHLKTTLHLGGREVGQPLRLALTGRLGEGPLDRVILLIDAAAALPFAVRVMTCRERLLAFLASLD